jgi:hypothetical protein
MRRLWNVVVQRSLIMTLAGLVILLATGPRSVLADDKALGTDGKVFLAAAAPAEGAAKQSKADESRAKLDAKLNPWPNQNGFISPTFDGAWRFRFALNGWLPTSLKIKVDDGDVNQSTTVGTDFILGNLKFIVPIDLAVRKGSFGAYMNTLAFKIGGSTQVGIVANIDWDVSAFLMDIGLSYELGKWIIGEGPNVSGIKLTVEPIIGARLLYQPANITLTRLGRSAGFDFTSFVPMFGLRTYWDLTEHWNLFIQGDYGGFGVMDNRQTWQGVILLGYRWRTSRMGWNLQGGFRGKRYFDFQKPDADIRQDALGPNIILSIDF